MNPPSNWARKYLTLTGSETEDRSSRLEKGQTNWKLEVLRCGVFQAVASESVHQLEECFSSAVSRSRRPEMDFSLGSTV